MRRGGGCQHYGPQSVRARIQRASRSSEMGFSEKRSVNTSSSPTPSRFRNRLDDVDQVRTVSRVLRRARSAGVSASATPVRSGSAVQIATIGDAASNGGLPTLAMATTVHASEKVSEAGVRGLEVARIGVVWARQQNRHRFR